MHVSVGFVHEVGARALLSSSITHLGHAKERGYRFNQYGFLYVDGHTASCSATINKWACKAPQARELRLEPARIPFPLGGLIFSIHDTTHDVRRAFSGHHGHAATKFDT